MPTPPLADYGVLGAVAFALIGTFAFMMRRMLASFERQIDRSGALATEQVRAMSGIADRLDRVRERVDDAATRVGDVHAFVTTEARRVAEQHAAIRADLGKVNDTAARIEAKARA